MTGTNDVTALTWRLHGILQPWESKSELPRDGRGLAMNIVEAAVTFGGLRTLDEEVA